MARDVNEFRRLGLGLGLWVGVSVRVMVSVSLSFTGNSFILIYTNKLTVSYGGPYSYGKQESRESEREKNEVAPKSVSCPSLTNR